MADKRWYTDHTRPDVWNKFASIWVDNLKVGMGGTYPTEAEIVKILEDVFEAGFETGSADKEHGISHIEDVRERIRSTR